MRNHLLSLLPTEPVPWEWPSKVCKGLYRKVEKAVKAGDLVAAKYHLMMIWGGYLKPHLARFDRTLTEALSPEEYQRFEDMLCQRIAPPR